MNVKDPYLKDATFTFSGYDLLSGTGRSNYGTFFIHLKPWETRKGKGASSYDAVRRVMLGIAGLGIAYHAKPVVKQGAGQAISTLGLDSILYLVGVRDRDTLA